MKKQLNITARRCIIATFLFSLLGLGGWGVATAQVEVTPLSATYTASPIVKFRVSWSSQTAANHLPKVWVIIDYDKVENNVAAHNWQPATITGATATNGTVTQHFPRGFFLAGAQTGFSADVTVTLSGMPAQFNWCAYALDYPPNATHKAGGGYDLHGTPPFTINGNITAPGKVFAAGTCITSITDLTGNPDGIAPAVGAASITGSANNACLDTTVLLSAFASGATTFTWYKDGTEVQTGTNSAYTVIADGNYTVQGKNVNCIGTISSAKAVTILDCGNVPGCKHLRLYQTTTYTDGNAAWSTANAWCTARGARLPWIGELQCMCKNKTTLPGGVPQGNRYWSATPSGATYLELGFSDCSWGAHSSGSQPFRCVL
jgi:hypothetical protein